MSTKLYHAYRLKPGVDLWTFSRRVKGQATERVQAKLVEVLKTLKPEVLTKEFWQWEAERLLLDQYTAAAVRSERSPFDFDVYLTYRELHGRVYLIPYGDMFMRDVWTFLDTDPDVEEYGYWNNTDKPRRISQAKWEQRGREWHAIDANGWLDYLTLEICTPMRFTHLMPETWTPEGQAQWAAIKAAIAATATTESA